MTFLVQQTLIYAVPLMIVALAGVFAERSGIINLALEGIMIFGAFIGVLFVRTMQGSEVFTAAKAAGDYATLQGLEIMAMVVAALLGAIFFSASVVCLHQPAGGPDHRRYGAEPDGARPGALLHPYYRQPEYPANGGRRCCQLVHDQKRPCLDIDGWRTWAPWGDLHQPNLSGHLPVHPSFPCFGGPAV